MLYYFDGQITPVIDAPSGPVYNFTKSNVIDGKFSYESTGSKTRINQVLVTWTNPDANYKPEPLIVEDRLNIAATGKIISQDAVAMGAISEGQALRYGRWKLWTAANQRELVNFSTSLNASFLVPGDIINVQDADRGAVRIGGRVSNSGTDISTVSIPLDNPTTLNSGSTYELSIIFVEPAAFATSDVTIAGVDYKKGDIIKQAYLTGSSSLQNIDTETKSLNAKASANATDALVLNWTDTTRVEKQTVSTSAGLTSTLTVSSAFSALPTAETVWVMTEVSGGALTTSSAKAYKILGLAQNSKNEYTITAVEHYDEKFNAVDEDFSTYIADTVYPPVIVTDDVPQPLDVFSTSLMRPEQVGEELTISWTPPANLGSIPGEYEHTFGYEITHDFPDYPNPIRINDSLQTNWSVQGITDGSYNVAVRTINTLNNLSEATRAAVTVSDRYKENIPRMPEGVPYTGTTSVGFGIVSDTFIFKRYAYTVKSPSGVSSSITNTNQTSTAWQQSCSTLPVISWSESDRAAEGEFVKEHAYILLDASNSTDRLKLLKYYRSFGVGFWYDIGSGNTTDKYGSALTGTFSKAADTSKVTGSGTAFLTQIKEGDILKLGSTEGYRVAAVVSDTLLYVTNSFSSFSGVQGFVPNIRIDYANDFIIARVYNTSSGLVLAESYAKIDAVLKPAGDIVEEGGVSTAEIAENAVTVEEIDTSAATGGTFGAAVAALDAASFSSIDTDVLDANSVIAREVQVFPSGATPPTISGTTLAGAGIDLKQDGDLYVGNYSDDKYMFWDQSEGTMTFRGTLNVDDITGSSATFGTLMAEVATIGTLNTKMLDSDAIVTRDIRVGPSAEITAGSFVVGTEYYITDLGNTTQAQWNSVAGTSSVVYNLGSIFTAANAGTGTGKARNRTTVAKIANTTLTGSGAHLNAAGDFYVGNASANKYMFWDQSAGTMTIRGELNADDITAGNITAANINVTNLQAISANLGNITAGTLKGGTIPEASSAPTTTESGTFFDLTGGRMVLGNASKYIWWNGTNLEINGVTISDATLSGSTGFATETFVNTAINNLVANAPAALDTLNEIAAALDDDASFHASVTTSLSNKVGTTSPQALSTAANVMTISGSTISLARANGDTDTVAVPNDNTEYTAGSGLALSGTTFSNSAPDQTVALTGSGATSISGTYPNFTISSSNTNTQRSDEEIRDLAASILTAGTNVSISVNDAANTATISSTNTQYTAGSGLSLSGTQFSNSAPDQTVSLTGAGGATISGTYPNFTISSANSVYTHPAYTPRSINTSGATVLDTFTSDAIGSVTSIGTRTLTLANLGYTGATNANLYVLPGSVVHSTESQALNSDPLRISGSTLSLYKGDGTFDSVTLPSVSPANNTITLTAGVGLSGGGAFTLNQGSNETITLTADLSELPDMTQTFTSTDELVVLDAGVSKRKQTSEIALSTFNNDLTFSAATTLGGQSASHYLNVNTTFGGDVSGKYNAIVIADDSHNHTIANVAGLQTALNGKVDDGQVLTNVPTGALFTDTNTNTITQIREDSGSYRTGNITLQSGTNVSITEPTTGVFRFTSTDTNTVYSHPNHSGDVTSSGDGAQTIANNVVTFAKMQDIATDTFMGRTASGSGDAKALSVSEARTMLNVENGATADQSASEILTLLKTVDSNTSGLNADTLDGQQGTYYYAASNPNSYTSNVGDITAVTVSAPITGGGTSGSVGIAITQASGSANGYLSSTDWTTFNNKSTFNGAYASLSGKPTLLTLGSTSSTALAGNTAIPVDLTTSGAGTVHANNYVNTQYVAATSSAFGLVKIGYSESGKNYPVELSNGQMYVNVPWTDNNDNTITRVKGTGGSLVSGDITITASGAATSTQSGNTINIASVNTNTEYTASDGVELSGTTFSLSTNMNGIALSVDSLAANKIDVGVLDADSVIARDIKVGPSGSEATYGATPSGTGAHITSSGNFYVGDYANDKYMLWNGSTLTIRGSLDANDINGVLLDTGSNRQISIGTTIAPGNQSVLIGPGAGGTGLGSTSLGKFAGGFTTGTDNVAIGQDAGMSVTTGNENIMIGSHTGRAPAGTTANKTGNNNIGIGAVSNQNTANGTLSDLTSGSNNIVFGKGAGRNITTGSGNVIIGGYAGVTNDESTITIATGTGSRRLYFDTSGNATFTGTVTGTRFFTTDGTNTLSTYVSGSYNQITSTGSASGGARDLRFNFGQSGTVMTLKSTQVHMAKTMLLDGATTNSTSTSNIISTANADTSSVTGYHISFTKSNGTTSLGRITTNNYSTTYTTSSDYRLKEDLVEITGATAKVLSIPTRNFKWIGSDVRTDGFLAHELASIVPDAVVGEKDAVDSEGNPDYQGIDQSKLVPLLVKTIQELEARIAALENP